MLIDEVTIRVTGGRGGDGVIAFDKTKGGRGPTGGRGGDGGGVFLRGTDNLAAPNQFRFKKDFAGSDGESGKTRLLDGAAGANLVLKIPVGTVINFQNGKQLEILEVDQTVQVARGGRGGRGNWFFRSSTNTTPKEFEEGKSGEHFELKLELRFIAHVGLIGLPSAGKSSLLNTLTKARAKTAAYPFTTLEPNLGDFYGLILADIPGLIEGASEGKGLGHKFLKHIERTEVLLHCVSVEEDDPLVAYRTIRRELEKYSPSLTAKPEYILLTKTDLITEEKLQEKLDALRETQKTILPFSIINDAQIENLKQLLGKIKQKKI